MLRLSLAEIAAVTGGKILQGEPGLTLDSVSTDSRRIGGGELYVALRGLRFDGHDFVADAAVRGAAAVLIQRDVPLPGEVAAVRVEDTLPALQALARHNRRVCGVPAIAVTGSTGKTTAKDMIAAVLAVRFRVLATTGNFNNEIGVPLTLLELNEKHQAAVVEMGMRGPGEIARLASIAEPHGAVITNVGETHIERLGSVENIARAKGEALDFIGKDGFALLNADSPYLAEQAQRCRGRVRFFGTSPAAAIRLLAYQHADGGSRNVVSVDGHEYRLELPVPGRHNAVNALAAIGAGLEMGMDFASIQQGLSRLQLSPMRQAIVDLGGVTVLNDAYNANPASMRAALAVLKEMAGTRPTVAVLGNMFELGERAQAAHYEVGEACAREGVGYLVTVGNLARETARGALENGMAEDRVRPCADNEEALNALKELLKGHEFVLVKGSRGMKMETVVAGLEQWATGQEVETP
ncbi:MAG: UDP-N-acetylmuramoyl-tripeptide--D-alanyl-D-alanine ligase [Bacillota bacterium]|uniref:UDP-N-acetylmuramoyl-tripeptide--D-alanyl-D- alanine ligase n=1 Tax=Desulforudis sp. DRI-14 TaxID=3459793 RepID=UPI003485437E